MESEEIIKIDRALEETKKIHSSLESTIQQVKKLKSKYESADNNYFYNFTPSKRPSFRSSRTEYLIFGIYDSHLSKLCQKLDVYSPQASPQKRLHHRVRRIQYPSSSCSSSPSTSSNEQINQLELDNALKNDRFMDLRDRKLGVRTHKELLAIYNRARTERIKCKREIEAGMISLDKALTQSTTRAMEWKNYCWIRPKWRTPARSLLAARRSFSTSICRSRQSTPVQVKRPLSTSVIFWCFFYVLC